MAKKGKLRHAQALKEVLDKLNFERTDFSRSGENDLPNSEKEVDAFIKKRISLWLSSWIKPDIAEAIEFLERN
jgi:hypothetical protein